MGNNPVIRFPSPTADAPSDSRVGVVASDPQRRIIRQPIPLPLPRSQRPPSPTSRPSLEQAPGEESGLEPDVPWLRTSGELATGQPCRRRATPASRGAFELDVSADFYATKANDLPPAIFGYWLPRCCQTPTAPRLGTTEYEGPEVLGYNDLSKPQPPSVLGYWPFDRPQPAEG
ncbi:MAG: hypothetical protein HKN03_03265 [Acidimicrobiales bacterium]|nr:hypothetical protein [Acidimicrobiales bacterium]